MRSIETLEILGFEQKSLCSYTNTNTETWYWSHANGQYKADLNLLSRVQVIFDQCALH